MSPPLATVALVVHRDQAYLEEAVASVLDQSFRRFELLVVDDASPDHGPEILDRLAETDDRLVLVRLDRAVTLGEARNIALDRARGSYVWFIETTDLLSPGALAAVANRLEETAPQVLVVADRRVGPLGRPRRGPHRSLIRATAASEYFTLDERPAALKLAPDVWTKIFAREFLQELGVRFGAGGYGELTVSYPALLAAERISALDRRCYDRRRPANAADEERVYGTPFDVFEQYDAVFAFVESRRDSIASRGSLLPEAMLRHCLGLFEQIPEEKHGAFFAELSIAYRRHLSGENVPGFDRRLSVYERLVRDGRYAPFHAVRWSAEQRRAATGRANKIRGRKGKIAKTARRDLLKAEYRLQLKRAIEPDLAVFAAYWYRGYSCNPKAIYEKLRELAPWMRGVWVVRGDHRDAMPEGVDYVVAGTREYYSLVARAKYFVNNVGFPEEVVKRKGTIRVHTHHGTPVKTMGLDQRDAFVVGSTMDVERSLRRWARWDYSVSQNAFSTLIWERAYPGRYETLEVGYPRNDALVNATQGDVERIRADLGIEPGCRTVLYAPTHREYLRRFVPVLDLRRLAEDLGPEYVVMARAHYFNSGDDRIDELYRAAGILDVTRHPSIEDLCLAADVLITDYSSIMFDYAVLDRPLVIHAPDWDVYRAMRGTYFDLPAEPPGVVATNDDELMAAFRSGAVWSEEAKGLRAAFRARFCYLDDGAAAERVARRIWLSNVEESTSARLPLERVDAEKGHKPTAAR
jgi:CDP-glycerol glycerophosphotransferase